MLNVVVLAASVLLQLAAAVLALRLVRVTGRTLGWVAIAAAVALMAVRRGSTLVALLRTPDLASSSTLPVELVALLISVLLVVGLVAMGPTFALIGRSQELEEGLGRVVESSLNEIYIFAAADLRFLRVNHVARANLGYSEQELSLLTPLDLKADFDESRFRELLSLLDSHQVPRVRFQTWHRRKDGSRYPIDVDLQPTRWSGRAAYVTTILDTTDRSEADRALRESEEHFRSLIEHSQDLTTVLDRQGRVVYQSPSVSRILGRTPAELIGTFALSMVHPDDRAAVQEALSQALSGNLTGGAIVHRLQHADGSWRSLEGVGSLRDSPDGERQIVLNLRDTTDRETALREKMEAETILRHSQRMETIGNLAGGIAHDFNNLLTPIIGYADLLSVPLKDNLEASRDLREIVRASTRAQELIQHLLVFSRREQPHLIHVAIEDVVQEVMSLVRLAAPTSITLRSELDAGGESILADAIQVHQVVMNLCTNAIDAMRGRAGQLTVTLTRVTECPPYPERLTSPRIGTFVRLSVSDTGVGIDPATMDRLFEPFFTTKRTSRGTGLGLAVVHGIVLSHGGSVTVSSTPGTGSTFNIYFPTVDRPAASHRAALDRPLSGSEHVMVVDDDPVVAQVIRRLLEPYQYRVTVAESPAAAVTLIQTGAPVDIVITDYDMPLMNGLDLAQRLHSIRPELPILLVTGLLDEAATQRMGEVGIVALVHKPFNGRDLAGSLRRALDGLTQSA